MDQLKPAMGEKKFFFEDGLRAMHKAGRGQVWTEDSARLMAVAQAN